MANSSLERTRAVIEDGMKAGPHIGAQVYVSAQGEALADFGVGEASPGAAMTPESIMLWMSAGKPLTAVAIARLWENGDLRLDDPAAKFVPEFAQAGKAGITIRHILTHTGGFRFADSGGRPGSWDETLQQIARSPCEDGWTPGERAGYHASSSWFVLGEIIQRITGQPFERALYGLTLEACGMWKTSFSLAPTGQQEPEKRVGQMMVTAHGKREALDRESAEGRAVVSPGASARGPMRDLARFYEMLLAGGRGFAGRALHAQTAEAITARHRAGMFDETFRSVLDWGLGFLLASDFYSDTPAPYGYGRYASRRTFGHSGSQSSCAFCDPVKGLVVAWVCNGMPGEPAHQKRQRAINEAIYEDVGLI